MTSETPDVERLAARLEAIAERLGNLGLQVRVLGTSETVEAREFVVRDDRGEIRVGLEMHAYAPRLRFYDRVGTERLRIGLRRDGTPTIQAGEREIPLAEAM